MADTVRYYLERTLPELEDLEKRGLFSPAEIKEIVKRRTNFEYLLKRHSVLKQDFLSYIQYELQLEALRKLRKKALVRGLKASGKRWRSSLSDRSLVMRIMLIYQRAVTRFKGDLKLWLRYMEFCRSHGPRRLQKVMAKALQLHSTVPGLWMYAAAWEFERNLNVEAARALMLEGIRACPRAQSLWHEYFTMELTYAQKLQARRLVLGLDSDSGVKSDQAPALTGDSAAPVRAEHPTYQIALTIFRNAVEKIPSSFAFRRRFVELLQGFDLPEAERIENDICDSLEKDFRTDEATWDWKAKQHLRSLSKIGFDESLQRAVKVYEDALKSVSTVRMYELYIRFLEDLLEHEDVDMESNGIRAAQRGYEIAERQLYLYKSAAEKGFSSEVVAHGHLSLLLRWGKLEEAQKLAADFCAQSFPKSSKLWHVRLSMELRRPLSTERERGDLSNLFLHALKSVSIVEAKPIWQMAMEFFSRHDSKFSTLLEILEASFASGTAGEAGADLAIMVVDWILISQGIERARQAYKRLLALPGPSINLIRHSITIESRTASLGDVDAFGNMRKLFDLAVKQHGREDTQLWLEYCQQELQAGNIEAAGAVHWRARKTLRDSTAFTDAYHQLTL